jgi:hypothetical protein
VPFSYYRHLSRARQAIYRKSDGISTVRLPWPEALRPLVGALAAALETEGRRPTQLATERLVDGLTSTLGLPAVRVEVLAVRPHAGWGELHGLYTATPGRTPKIQLWMRTARQRRVVAFRTYLRTLLHEVGHHLDYTLLGLKDSLHTEGFYKRESSLFHQLVPAEGDTMMTMEEWAKAPREDRLARLGRTPDELAAAVRGRDAALLARRPDPKNWSPVEVVCHLRDVEEAAQARFELILASDAPPRFLAIDPDRWAEERQYLRHEAAPAVAAFRRRRAEVLGHLGALKPPQWDRAGIHATRGPMTVDAFVTLMAWHDDNHLAQLHRALDGKP